MSLSDSYIAAQNLVAESKLLMMQMTIADRRLSKISSELAEMGLSLNGEPLQPTQFFPPKTSGDQSFAVAPFAAKEAKPKETSEQPVVVTKGKGSEIAQEIARSKG